ncbi:MAG: peptidylprolyl isomerase [Tannerellaceae bacterium]|nr:peptidylprolyl isomerase [Tannerellaceae bacterium]
MKVQWIPFLLLFLFVTVGCKEKPLDPDKPVYVTVKTNMGDVTVMLYDDTPLHRDNFIRLCQNGEQDGVIFHRVIKEFVMQGGDPASKAQEPGVHYGSGDGGYRVPAEILPHHFNKRGALIDAKKADATNPERLSAGTQFCFVQGKVLTDEELDEIEIRIDNIRRNWLHSVFSHRLKARDPKFETEEFLAELEEQVALMVLDTLEVMPSVAIPAERREIYKTIGGVPHLDGSVTIFGEVVEGFDIVEKMSLVETDKNDRPLQDLIVLSTKVFQK